MPGETNLEADPTFALLSNPLRQERAAAGIGAPEPARNRLEGASWNSKGSLPHISGVCAPDLRMARMLSNMYLDLCQLLSMCLDGPESDFAS